MLGTRERVLTVGEKAPAATVGKRGSGRNAQRLWPSDTLGAVSPVSYAVGGAFQRLIRRRHQTKPK